MPCMHACIRYRELQSSKDRFCRTSTTGIKHLKPVLESACMHAKPTRRRDTALGYTGFIYNEGTCGLVHLQAYYAGFAFVLTVFAKNQCVQ